MLDSHPILIRVVTATVIAAVATAAANYLTHDHIDAALVALVSLMVAVTTGGVVAYYGPKVRPVEAPARPEEEGGDAS